MMKRLVSQGPTSVLLAAILLCARLTGGAWAGIVNNSGSLAADSICIPFQLLDTLANPVRLASGDSLWVYVWYPSGALAAADSARITSDTKIKTRQLQAGSKAAAFYSYQNSVTALIGTAKNGVYKYTAMVYDSSLALLSTVNGEFQVLLTGDLDATLDSTVKTTIRGRTFDVSATGEGGIDWANIGSPTTAVNLSATEIRRADSAMNVANLASTDTLTTILGNVNGTAGVNWGNVANTGTAVNLSATEIRRADSTMNVANIASTDTLTTILGNVNGSVGSVTTNNDKTGYTLTGAGYASGADSVWAHDTSNVLWNGLAGRFGYWNAKQQIGGGGAGNDSLQIRRWVWDSTAWRYHEPGGTRYKRTVDTLLETLAECGGTGAYPCTLFVFQSPGGVTALQGVFLRVFNSTQTATAATGTTDANGRAIFSLDVAVYKVYGYQGGYAFNPQPLSVTVTTSGANDTLLATPYNPGAPATPDLCRVYGWVSDLSGDQIAQASVHARISESPLRFQNLVISPYERVTSTDSSGYWYLDLFPSSVLNPTTTRYEFEIRFTSGAILRRKVAVPDSAQWFFTW